MWKNKHVVIAMLVAPVLAIIAYFAVDYLVSEKPHAAKPGADYPLAARSNCRYASGSCDLVNGDFKLTIRDTGKAQDSGLSLNITSRHPLSSASVGFASRAGAASTPVALTASATGRTEWSGAIAADITAESVLQIVVTADRSNYFAEVPTVFLTEEQ